MGEMAVVGAGLVGSLWARMLGNRGHEVVVYERRPDPRLGPLHGGRSINLALSDRGWKALERAGVADQVRDIALPIRGRRMHAVDGTKTFQPYGLEGQCIYSVSRAGLNRILVEAAENMPNVTFEFDHRCHGYDVAEPMHIALGAPRQRHLQKLRSHFWNRRRIQCRPRSHDAERQV